jgi:hypothetical protein
MKMQNDPYNKEFTPQFLETESLERKYNLIQNLIESTEGATKNVGSLPSPFNIANSIDPAYNDQRF